MHMATSREGGEEDGGEVGAYLRRFAGVPSCIRILPPEGSLEPLLALARVSSEQQPEKEKEHSYGDVDDDGGEGRREEGVVVALDLDQTLVVGAGLGAGADAGGAQVRGGEDTVRTLSALWAAGARLAVITAAASSTDNARLVASLLRRLGLAREFASAALDPAPLLSLLRRLAPDSNEEEEKEGGGQASSGTGHPCHGVEEQEAHDVLLARETKRAIGLLALSTGRRPADLVRIGYSTIRIEPDHTKAWYRLAQISGTNAGGWSALQSLAAHQERALCAVDCLAAYIKLTSGLRERRGSDPPDRLFLSPSSNEKAVSMLSEAQIAALLEEIVQEAGVDPHSPEARELFQDSAELVTLDGGVKIARYRHIMCARYNKPEALLDFITRHGGSPPRKIIFVDDNSDNVFNMFHFFASRQLEQLSAGKDVRETTTIVSCWYPPPSGGKMEAHDPTLLDLIRRMATLGEEVIPTAQHQPIP